MSLHVRTDGYRGMGVGHAVRRLAGLLCVLGFLLTQSAPIVAAPAVATTDDPARRVNVPHFSGDVTYSQMAVFWFGTLDSASNSVDVRVGYNSTHLYLNLSIYDRYLWYDPSPEDSPLDAWDAASIYLDTAGDGGSSPDSDDYRFVGQLNWWESGDEWQAAYKGNGSSWSSSATSFTVTSGWRGDAPNNGNDDRAWVLRVWVPFSSLGMSGPPQQGTAWRLGVAVHDRDDSGGSYRTDKVWPETFASGSPGTWGGLVFGLPSYEEPDAAHGGTVTVREGLNGATVYDAGVGGTIGNNCPGDATTIWNVWANANMGDEFRFNIQNQGDVSDFPCFSRYYVKFPLNAVPAGKAILDATLTLYRWGGADPANAQSSLIQVSKITDPWSESTITWNNAPLAVENIARTWVSPVQGEVTIPGEPFSWDVSQAVADAYETGSSVSLALYEADWAYHSGKYFIGSEEEDYYAYARPTLTVVWGDPAGVADLDLVAMPGGADQGETIEYTLWVTGSGEPLSLVNELPDGVSSPTGMDPELDYGSGRITWSGTPGIGQVMALSYSVNVTTGSTTGLVSTATLTQHDGSEWSTTSVAVANPIQAFLPLVLR